MRFLDMAEQIALANERFAALAAPEWLLPGVRSPMGNQVALRYEVLRAQVAPKRALRFDALVVAALVEEQIALQRKRLAALVARVRPFARVASTGNGWS